MYFFQKIFANSFAPCTAASRAAGPAAGASFRMASLNSLINRFTVTFYGSGCYAHVGYSISMRSRRAVSPSSEGRSGLASSPTPRKTSKPALRKCPVARLRRFPGNSTYATTPSMERPRRGRGSADISGGRVTRQPHPQLVALDLRAGCPKTHHRVRQQNVPLVAPDPYQEFCALLREVHALLINER